MYVFALWYVYVCALTFGTTIFFFGGGGEESKAEYYMESFMITQGMKMSYLK